MSCYYLTYGIRCVGVLWYPVFLSLSLCLSLCVSLYVCPCVLGVDPELTASVEAAAKLLAETVGGEIVPVELPAGEELQSMIDGASRAGA